MSTAKASAKDPLVLQWRGPAQSLAPGHAAPTTLMPGALRDHQRAAQALGAWCTSDRAGGQPDDERGFSPRDGAETVACLLAPVQAAGTRRLRAQRLPSSRRSPGRADSPAALSSWPKPAHISSLSVAVPLRSPFLFVFTCSLRRRSIAQFVHCRYGHQHKISDNLLPPEPPHGFSPGGHGITAIDDAVS